MNLPNKLTLVRIGCVPIYLALLAWQQPAARVAAFLLFCFAALTDLLDGQIARRRDQVTNFGKFMDPIADKLLVILAFVMLVGLGTVPAWMCILFVAREFIVSGLRLVAVEQGVVIAAGFLGKAKTVAQMAAVLLLTLSIPSLRWLEWVALVVALLLTVWSCVDYLYKGKDLLGGKNL